jgi:hypothetical protein
VDGPANFAQTKDTWVYFDLRENAAWQKIADKLAANLKQQNPGVDSAQVLRVCARFLARFDEPLSQESRVQLLSAIAHGDLKCCEGCGMPAITRRRFCGERCRKHVRRSKDRRRELGRRFSGESKDRKRKEREIQDLPRPKASQLDRAISAVFRRHGKPLVTSEHCETARKDARYRRNTLAFLTQHDPKLEKQLHAYFAITRRARSKN